MPLVFVHGVATRQTAEYQAWVRQRDELFTRLVLPKGARVFDPDWGSNAVKITSSLPWLPTPGGEPFALGSSSAATDTGIAKLASKNPEAAIDLAFETGLAVRARAAAKIGKPQDALTDEDIAAFEAAVRYLESGADKDVFDPDESDANFLSTLTGEPSRTHPRGRVRRPKRWESAATSSRRSDRD
jgi:hypothetical protein